MQVMNRAAVALLTAALCLPAAAEVISVPADTPSYVGSSTDTKPVRGVQPGAIFRETDTGISYIWNSKSTSGTQANWVQWGEAVFLGNQIAGEDRVLDRTFGGPKGLCKVMTSDGVIKGEPGMLIAVYASGIETGDAIVIYDNASAASGTAVFNQSNLGAGDKQFPNVPAAAANGLYLDLTNAGGSTNPTLTVCYL